MGLASFFGYYAGIDVQHAGTLYPVVDVVVVPAAADDAGFPQHAQVPGDGGHIDADQLLQFADAVFRLLELVQNKEPGGMRHGFEHPGGVGVSITLRHG